MSNNHLAMNPQQPLLTPSGRRIDPNKKLGRPKGAVSTTEQPFENLLHIMFGSEGDRVVEIMKANGCSHILGQRVGISIKWAESRGYVFKQKELPPEPIEMDSPHRPARRAVGEAINFDDDEE